uniref:Uncharacterized protein n=1 Tax=Cacopsylla melanoneura TaxID=428564 RepID=A0A8D9BGG3_9HEMI
MELQNIDFSSTFLFLGPPVLTDCVILSNTFSIISQLFLYILSCKASSVNLESLKKFCICCRLISVLLRFLAYHKNRYFMSSLVKRFPNKLRNILVPSHCIS